MIQAKELRVGNKVSGMTMVQTIKSIIDHKHRYDYDGHGEARPGYEHLILVEENGNQYKPFELDPIPLTPEILEKAGFEYLDHFTACKGILNFKRSCGGTGLNFHYEHGRSYQATLIYLHQLQNLYFALIGEELTINLKK